MAKVEFTRVETDEEVEDISIKDGQLIYSKSGKTYMDYGDERIPTGSGSGGGAEEVEISDTEPTDPDNKIWIDTGEVSAAATEITNEYSTSTGLGYSANYINDKIIPTSYSITNTPEHSAGTNSVYINKIGNLVVINCDSLWFNSITANTWLKIGDIPSAVYPPNEVAQTAVISLGSNGNIVSYARVIITTTGEVRIKTGTAQSSLSGCSFSISWVLD